MRKFSFLLALGLIFLFPQGHTLLLAQKTVAVDTYYISPINSYKYIHLVPRNSLGAINAACTDFGETYANNPNWGEPPISFCLKTDTAAGQWSFVPSLWTQALSTATGQTTNTIIFLNEDPSVEVEEVRVGIGMRTPPFKLTLTQDAGILSRGEVRNPLNIYMSQFSDITPGTFPLFLWYPQKAAFRAQHMDSSVANLWAESSVGYHSTALGNSNIAAGSTSFAAGETNSALNWGTGVFGGRNNSVNIPGGNPTALNAVIIGGFSNRITGPWSMIGGGTSNVIDKSNFSVIGGGQSNQILNNLTPGNNLLTAADLVNSTHSVILGGRLNIIRAGNKCAIGGGYNNTIGSSVNYSDIHHSAILGGSGNKIYHLTSTIPPEHSTIAGGLSNYIYNSFSVIGGGTTNRIYSKNSVILGGKSNTIGSSTLVNVDFAVITGNSSNTIQGAYSTVSGSSTVTPTDGKYFFLGGSTPLSKNLRADYAAILGSSQGISPNATHSFVTADYLRTGFTYATEGAFSVNHGGRATGDYSWTFSGMSIGASTAVTNDMPRSFVFHTGMGITNENLIGSDMMLFKSLGETSTSLSVGIGVLNPPLNTMAVAGTIATDTLTIKTIPTTSQLPQRKLYFDGNTAVFSTNDIAETFPSSEPVEPGDVLSLDMSRPGRVQKSNQRFDSKVIGIVSYLPAMIFEGNRVVLTPQPTAQTDQPPIALAGKVLVKVCGENGPIKRGDLLTTSSQPGVAMKADNQPQAIHAVIGKALENYAPSEEDKNQITMILAIVMTR